MTVADCKIKNFSKNDRFYLIGIGGCGMSALAHILIDSGYSVSGSDTQKSIYTEQLINRGIQIFYNHSPENIASFQPSIVVHTSAVNNDNPELNWALKQGLQIFRRGALLSQITKNLNPICIAGMHGKTTTSAMLAYALQQLNHSLGNAIGWNIPQLERNGKVNCTHLTKNNLSNKYFTIETDESDGTFTLFSPAHSIVLNIDREHMDYFGNFERLKTEFSKFITRTFGHAVYCIDSEELAKLACGKTNAVSYGLSESASYRLVNFQFHSKKGWKFEVLKNGNPLGKFNLQLLGLHNVLNATAVITMLDLLEFKYEQILPVIASFKGAERRQQELYNDGFVQIFDDYGHHPQEIKATINALNPFINNRLLIVFQPHRYTRTIDLLKEFGLCFEGASKIWIMDIYGAGEKPIKGVTSELIVNELKKNGYDAEYEPSETTVAEKVLKELQVGDIALFCGAGADVTRAAHNLSNILKSKVYGFDCNRENKMQNQRNTMISH
ncbi:MAG: UDP-N-acetylmuramate--L-alanine ligase [Verrucomicrobiae bacterium]|nr:UDP-N-acetylmuramate--L-alanine ligase [Verrucomicrobiae bacterium]